MKEAHPYTLSLVPLKPLTRTKLNSKLNCGYLQILVMFRLQNRITLPWAPGHTPKSRKSRLEGRSGNGWLLKVQEMDSDNGVETWQRNHTWCITIAEALSIEAKQCTTLVGTRTNYRSWFLQKTPSNNRSPQGRTWMQTLRWHRRNIAPLHLRM